MVIIRLYAKPLADYMKSVGIQKNFHAGLLMIYLVLYLNLFTVRKLTPLHKL